MKRYLLIIILIAVLVACLPKIWAPEKIGLIPLDSRPCNTQYPEILVKMINKNIEIPYKYLDNYLIPADTDNLWNWLNAEVKNFSKIIINTNELFNGSLIASRHADSYKNIESDLKRLEEFCQKNRQKKIILITVLPRILPSQFSDLWKFKSELTTYAKDIDQQILKGNKPPEPPKNVPKDIINKYLSIYENAQLIIEKVIYLTNNGLIDHYLIGQDDAEEFGLSNKIIREIKTSLNNKIQFVHGADELTMLALAKAYSPRLKKGINVIYSNKELKNHIFPYEAAELGKVVNTKMNYLNIPENPQSSYLEIIHNDSNRIDTLKKRILESNPDYLGIMDIAYTNKGDTSLVNFLFSQEILKDIDGYAGWNTASNTIGTELAHFIFHQNLKENFNRFNRTSKEEALKSYIKFKFIRIAEDLIYQGIIRDKLNKELVKRNLDPHNLGENINEAEIILRELYKPYQIILEDSFVGEYSIGKINFTVEKISSEIELPWARTFEAKIIPKVILKVGTP